MCVTIGHGGVARTIECQSIKPAVVSKLMQFCFTPLCCLCHLEDTLKGTGPYYKLSKPGEAKDLMHTNIKMSWIRKS